MIDTYLYGVMASSSCPNSLYWPMQAIGSTSGSSITRHAITDINFTLFIISAISSLFEGPQSTVTLVIHSIVSVTSLEKKHIFQWSSVKWYCRSYCIVNFRYERCSYVERFSSPQLWAVLILDMLSTSIKWGVQIKGDVPPHLCEVLIKRDFPPQLSEVFREIFHPN